MGGPDRLARHFGAAFKEDEGSCCSHLSSEQRSVTFICSPEIYRRFTQRTTGEFYRGLLFRFVSSSLLMMMMMKVTRFLFFSHDSSRGADDGDSRARALGVFPRRGGACPAQLHPHRDSQGGSRAAGQQERVGAERGLDGEFIHVTVKKQSVVINVKKNLSFDVGADSLFRTLI